MADLEGAPPPCVELEPEEYARLIRIESKLNRIAKEVAFQLELFVANGFIKDPRILAKVWDLKAILTE